MASKRTWVFTGAGILFAVLVGIVASCRQVKPKEAMEEIRPVVGPFEVTVDTTGVVEPLNRLELKPPIGGRIETIRVKEGQDVRAGEILALMSSTERAALLDAARLKDPEEVEYWERVYKPTTLVAPIDGKVIVRAVEPGQTVTANDAVFVLSDRLIVKANVDETDIGGVAEGQTARITLDAYPDVTATGTVGHISYESTVVNNVTMYMVDIMPNTVPEVFRSGMSADIVIVHYAADRALQIPVGLAEESHGRTIVLVKDDNPRGFAPREVTLGRTNMDFVEVLSGITAENMLVHPGEIKAGKTRDVKQGDSPFMPPFRGRRGGGGGPR